MADTKKTPSGDKRSQNLFYRDKIFPDAKALLQYKQKAIEEIKSSCLVGIDANILLLPYQLNQVSLTEIVKVYTSLNAHKRLIIPGQALREFFTRRAEKLGTIVQHLRDEASKLEQPLKTKIGILDNEESFQKAKKIANEIGKLSKTLQSQLNDIANNLSLRVGDDPVSVAYSSLTEAIRELEFDAAHQTKFQKDLEWRYAHKIPPGYMDAKNPSGGAGDLLIWKTILNEGKQRHKDFIFVTAEEKPDWWVRSHGTFQPRLELLEEYRRETGGHTIHIIKLSTLLRLFEVKPEILTVVRGAEEANTAIATLKRTYAEHYSFQIGVQPEQARQLVLYKDELLRELAQTEEEIRNWTSGMGWLPQDQQPLPLPKLRERQRHLQAKIDWIDRQLTLTPPPNQSSDQ
jgi:PIN like domain